MNPITKSSQVRSRASVPGTGPHGNNPNEGPVPSGTGHWNAQTGLPDVRGDECLGDRLPPSNNMLLDRDNKINMGTVFAEQVKPQTSQLLQQQATQMQIRNRYGQEVFLKREEVQTAEQKLKGARASGATGNEVSELKAEVKNAKKALAVSVKQLKKQQRQVNEGHQQLEQHFFVPRTARSFSDEDDSPSLLPCPQDRSPRNPVLSTPPDSSGSEEFLIPSAPTPQHQNRESRNRALRVAVYGFVVATTFLVMRQFMTGTKSRELELYYNKSFGEVERDFLWLREDIAANPARHDVSAPGFVEAMLVNIQDARSEDNQTVMLALGTAMVIASICWIIERRLAGPQ